MASIDFGGRRVVSHTMQQARPPAKGLAAMRFKNLLIVSKESRLTRFNKQGVKMGRIDAAYTASM